jgi:hypothetical protein
MNDKQQQLYNYLKENGLTDLDANTFFSKYSDQGKSQEVWSYLKDQGMTDLDANSFYSSYFKKKSPGTTDSTSGTGSSASSKGEIFTGYPGKGDKPYQFNDGKWYEEAPVKVYGQEAQYVQIQDPNRIGNLNKQFKKDASLSQQEEVFNNYDDEKADNQYRVKDGQWQRMTPGSKWHTIQNEGSINALNNRYGKSVSTRVATTTTMKPAKFDDINSDFVGKTEENAIKYLTEKYGKYGFEFSEEGLFAIDQIRVKTKDGSKELLVEFDEKNPEKARDLRAFLETNATKSYSENFDKALGALNKGDIKIKPQTGGSSLAFGTDQSSYEEESAAIVGKNLLSSDFQSQFKKLPFEEQKEIIQKKIAGGNISSKDVQSFYKSSAYQDYKKKKIGGDQQSKAKQDQIYDDYKYALATKDPAKIKEAKAKINTYYTDEIIQDNVKTYNMKLNDLEQSQKNILQDRKVYDDEVNRFNELAQSGKMTQEQFDAQKKILDNKAESLETRAQNLVMQKKEIQASQNKLNLVAGKYVAAKEKEGSFGGFVVNKVLSGVSMTFAEPFAGLEAIENRYDYLSPEEKAYYKSIKYNGKNLTKDQIENLLDNQAVLKAKNQAKENIIDVLGSEGTTIEYMKSGDRGFITQAIGGVLESLPAMATGVAGKAAGFIGLAAQAYSGIEEEMLSDPDFQYTSAGDRAIIAIPYAAGMGVLESVGLQNLVKGDSFLGKVMMDVAIKSAKKVGANATKEALERVAAKEVESLLAKGLIRVTQAGVAEFETGFTQALVLDQGLKNVYNYIQQSGLTEEQKKNLTQGEYFDTADGFKQLASQTFEDGVAEMIGGAIMGSVGTLFKAVTTGNVSLYNEDDVKFLKDIATDSDFKKLYVASMKTQMMDGIITKSKAQQNLDNLNEIESAFQMMPNGLSTSDMNKSLSLITERAQLTREKGGKDPNLVAPIEARIKAINEELTKIGENAFQEQATSEVSVQPGATGGREMAKGEPETGLEETTQKAKEEVDLKQIISFATKEVARLSQENISSEEKQSLVDKIYEDPIAYARENNTPGSPSENFLNSLERAPVAEIDTNIQKAKQEIDQYIADMGAEARLGATINPIMEKMSNAEFINDNDIDTAIEAIFSEVEQLDKSDQYSPETKAAMSEKLLNIADKLDNYEFRTKTETVATTKAGAASPTRRTSEAVQKIRAEKYFNGVQAEVNGQQVTLSDNNGRVEAAMPNGEVIVIDTPTMEINEDGFEFDDNGALQAVVVTDRLGNTLKLTGEQALDFAIRDRENKLGVVEQAEFETAYQQVEKQYIKEGKAEPAQVEEAQVEEAPAEEVQVEEEAPKEKVNTEDNLITEKNAKLVSVKFKRNPIVRAALNIMKALPGVKIYLHENTDQYASALADRTGESKQSITKENSAGSYIDGEIHIDMTKADMVTLLHEAVHHAFAALGVSENLFIDLAKGLRPLITDKTRLAELDTFIESYDGDELKAEEFMAQLGGILADNREELTVSKLTQFKALINRLMKKIGLGVIFKASATTKEAADLINAITFGLTTGENILTMQPYVSGVAVNVKPNAPMKVKYQRKAKYDTDFTTDLPTKTLKEVVEKYDGKVFVIQSDATGVGYDSNGDPIYGGIGYIAIKDNVDGKIGFASVDMKTAKTTISKMINRYGANEKIAVLVMAQNPSSTVGNYYGGKYFGRALIELQKQSKTNYKAIAQSFVDFIESKKSVVDALNKNKTHQKLIDLIKNPGKYDEVGFAQEFVKDTTFDVRREILKTLLPEKADIRTNKSTPYIKQSLKDLGFNRMDFLNEYGDNTLFTEEMYSTDEGGLLAAGFEMTLPSQEGINDFTAGIENKGIKHHLFNGKLPYSDESFLLDGLYPINENFSQFAKAQMVFNEETLNSDKIQQLVNKRFPEDRSYDDKFTNTSSKNFIPRGSRTYTHLTSPNKIKFKEELQATNPEYFKEQTPDVATDVARGMGFTAERGAKQEALVEKAKTEGFSKRKKQLVYNASPRSVEELGKRSGVVYFATDKREANAYAEGNRGQVREFEIPESDISNEQVVLDKINELGLQPNDTQYTVEESNLYELIDDRFDNSLSQADIKKLFDALKADGVTAFRYKDGAQVVEGTTESIAVIDNRIIAEKSTRKKQLTTDKNAMPGSEAALEALGETEAQREAWRNKNKVNQKQKRNPIVQQAVKDYYNEEISQKEYLDIVAKNQPIKPFKEVPALPSLSDITNSLKSNQLEYGIIGLTKNLKDGEKVATRLDIPAYENYDTWVVSIHDGVKEGKSIAYGQTAVLKNVDFKTLPKRGIQIAMGADKTTIGRMFGEWFNEDPEVVHARAKELMNDPAWTQVGMNPFRYSWFYDKADGMPLASADEVVQVGALVLAKNAKKVSTSDPMFETKSAKGGKIKFQKAPKILGGKPTQVIVKDEYKALLDQIKLEARAQREQKREYKKILADISATVTSLKSKGNISVKQFDFIMKKLKGLNFDNKQKVSEFIDYVSRALVNAEYIDNVQKAKRMTKSIAGKLKGKPNPFAIVAKMFTSLDAEYVENIADHIAVAQMIMDGVKASSTRGGKLTLKEEPDLQVIAQYIDAEQQRQTDRLLKNLQARYESITGKSSANLPAETMLAELQALKPNVDNSADILDQIDLQLAAYSQLIDEDTPQVIIDAINIDAEEFGITDSIKVLDALDTYFANGVTSGIESLMGAYEGMMNAKKFKFKSSPMSIAMSEKLGRTRLGLFAGFSRILERKFRSVDKANAYQKASGINDIIVGANKADFEATFKQSEYIRKFGKMKGFFSNENIYERGIIADLIRTNPNIDQDAEFDRLINILMDSKNMLLQSSDETKVRMGKLYDKVFKKLGLYNTNVSLESVLAKAEQMNIDAVNFAVDMFAEKYEQMSDTAMGVYNIMLNQDINYTPKTYVNIKQGQSKDSDALSGSDVLGIGQYSNNYFNRNEAGVLMPITRPKDLKSNGKYVDLNFDNNMFRSYRLALTDSYTAKSIRQLNSFYNSRENEEIIGSERDFDIIKSALSDYINTIKGKNLIDKNLLQGVDKFLNMISTFGAVRALAGIGQFANQFASGMSNTIVNAGEHMRPSDFSKGAFDFMNKSGQPIANVGENDILISLANLDKSIERATIGKSIAEVGLDKFTKFNAKAFQLMISNPDAIARRLAWMAYYRKYVIKNKLGPIDFNGEPNADASAYAQSMVDRSMDTTDSRVRGELYRSQNTYAKIIKSMLFPFSSFGMNQRTRMWGDLTKIVTGDFNLDTARSLASIGAEIAVYNIIRFQMAKLILYAAMNLLGYDEDEQDELVEKLKKNMLSSSWSKAVVDVLSPLALADNYVLKLANDLMEFAGIGAPNKSEVDEYIDEENRIRELKKQDPLNTEQEKKKREDYLQENSMKFYISDEANFGTLGIQWEKMTEAYDIYKAMNTGEFTDNFDRTVYLDDEGMEKIKGVAILKTIGVVAPVREVDQIANKSFSLLKKSNKISEKVKDMSAEIKKKYGKLDPVLEMLAQKKNKMSAIDDEINFINKTLKEAKKEGLTADQKIEYAKILEYIPKPDKKMLLAVKDGQTADQILKK